MERKPMKISKPMLYFFRMIIKIMPKDAIKQFFQDILLDSVNTIIKELPKKLQEGESTAVATMYVDVNDEGKNDLCFDIRAVTIDENKQVILSRSLMPEKKPWFALEQVKNFDVNTISERMKASIKELEQHEEEETDEPKQLK